jgi:hypothetical protein
MSDAGGLQSLQAMPNTRTNTRCSLQYNSLWIDAANITYFGFWDVSFHPADPGQAFSRFAVQAATHCTRCSCSLPQMARLPTGSRPRPSAHDVARAKAGPTYARLQQRRFVQSYLSWICQLCQ